MKVKHEFDFESKSNLSDPALINVKFYTGLFGRNKTVRVTVTILTNDIDKYILGPMHMVRNLDSGLTELEYSYVAKIETLRRILKEADRVRF